MQWDSWRTLYYAKTKFPSARKSKRKLMAEMVEIVVQEGGRDPFHVPLDFGIHKGKSIWDIAQIKGEMSYLEWLSDQRMKKVCDGVPFFWWLGRQLARADGIQCVDYPTSSVIMKK